MNFLTNEEQILNSDENKVILTTHRIEQTTKEWGSYYSMSLFLEDISAVELRAQSIPLLLILGVLLLLIGFYTTVQAGYGSQQAFIFIVTGLVLLGAWLLARQRMIKVTANSGRAMSIDARRLSQQKSKEFMNKLLQAKSTRIDSLCKK